MSEERRDGWLMRLLSKPLFGSGKPPEPRRKFEELSHIEQQEALLLGEREHRTLCAILGWAFVKPVVTSSFLLGLTADGLLQFSQPPVNTEYRDDAIGYVRQSGTALFVTFTVLVLFHLLAGRVIRWATCRWPNRLASIDSKEQREKVNRLNKRLYVAIAAVSLVFLIASGIVTSPFVALLGSIAAGVVGHYMLFTRRGSEAVCRKCGYGLPLDEALPARCTECGIALREPWGRALGQPRRKLHWWLLLASAPAGAFTLGWFLL